MKSFQPILGTALALTLALGLSFASTTVNAAGDQGNVNPKGYSVPRKGPLISEIREEVGKYAPGVYNVIRIYEDEFGNRVQEYSIGDKIYQLEVTPYGGRPYYLIDPNGGGLFTDRLNGAMPHTIVPQWVLFRF